MKDRKLRLTGSDRVLSAIMLHRVLAILRPLDFEIL